MAGLPPPPPVVSAYGYRLLLTRSATLITNIRKKNNMSDISYDFKLSVNDINSTFQGNKERTPELYKDVPYTDAKNIIPNKGTTGIGFRLATLDELTKKQQNNKTLMAEYAVDKVLNTTRNQLISANANYAKRKAMLKDIK